MLAWGFKVEVCFGVLGQTNHFEGIYTNLMLSGLDYGCLLRKGYYPYYASSYNETFPTVVSLITFSSRFSSTSVKIWSSSGISLALLWKQRPAKVKTEQPIVAVDHLKSTQLVYTILVYVFTSGRRKRCSACSLGPPGDQATCVAPPPWRTCLCTSSWAETASLAAAWWLQCSPSHPSILMLLRVCLRSALSPPLIRQTGIPPGRACPDKQKQGAESFKRKMCLTSFIMLIILGADLRLKNKSFQTVESLFPFLLGHVPVCQILQPTVAQNK